MGGAALVTVAFIGLYLFFVASLTGQSADQLSYDGAEFGRRSVTPFTRGLLDLVPTVSVIVALVVTGVISLIRRNWRTLLIALGAAAAAVISAQLLKYGILNRPDLGVLGYAGNSFPSGHTTVAAAAALVVFLVAGPRLRPLMAVAGTAFAVLAGVATLANQWHRPSDVIASLLVVAFWGCVGGAILTWPRRDGSTGAAAVVETTRVRLPEASTVVRLLRVLLVPFAALAVLAFAATFLGEFGASVDLLVAYLGGVTAIVTTGLILALTGIRMFSRLP